MDLYPFLFSVLLDAHELVFCYKWSIGAEESKENKYIFLENQMSFPLDDILALQTQLFNIDSLRIFQSEAFLCGLNKNGKIQAAT